ncbi:MAG: ParB/RepB/Spo0J family partition protein [Planctomycetia bacterium]|nr:ParB/RepB/Spo0J family partition protein [Planctomycetia bacterium]
MSKSRRLGRGIESILGRVASQNDDSYEPYDPSVNANSADSESSDKPQEHDADQDADAYPDIVSFPLGDQTDASRARRSVASEIEDEKDRVLAKFSDGRSAIEVSVELIDRNPYQPRLDFPQEEMTDLEDSLRRHGMIQPIVVRRKGERYELVAGERRFRAAQQVGWKSVPAILFVVEDQQMAELALTENMQRHDLNPIEKALAFRNYLDAYGGTQEELAAKLALDRSTVTNFLRLLDLNEEVQTMTRRGEITQGHAKALLPLEDWDQLELAQRIVQEKLSVRQTEEIVRSFLNGQRSTPTGGKKPGVAEVNPRIQDLESQLRTWLGMKVKLTANDKGKGKLVVQFNSNTDFERIYQALKPRDF